MEKNQLRSVDLKLNYTLSNKEYQFFSKYAYKKIDSHIKSRIFLTLICLTISSLLIFKFTDIRSMYNTALIDCVWMLMVSGIFTVLAIKVFFKRAIKCKSDIRTFIKSNSQDRVMQFSANENGVNFSSFNKSIFIKWRDIDWIAECEHGFIFKNMSGNTEYYFLPSNYMTHDFYTSLRELFISNFVNIKFKSKAKISDEISVCSKYKMNNLIGKLHFVIKNKTENIFSTFLRIKKERVTLNPLLQKVYNLIIMLLMFIAVVLSASSIYSGIVFFLALSFLLFSARFIYFFVLGIFENKNLSGESKNIYFYDNAIYINSYKSASIIEYDKIRAVQASANAVIIVSNYDSVRVTKNDNVNIDELLTFLNNHVESL